MKLLRCCVLALVWSLAACGGSSNPLLLDTSGSADSKQAEDTTPDPGEDTTGEPGQDTTGEPDGVAGTDTATDLQPDTIPQSIYSEEFMEGSCADYCEVVIECGIISDVDMEECVDDCLSKADDLGFMKTMVCYAINVDGEEDQGEIDCTHVGLCTKPAEPAECGDFCDGLDACGFLGIEFSDFLGSNVAECLLVCGGFATLSPPGAFDEISECTADALIDCSGIEFMVCMNGGEEASPCEDLCDPEGPSGECGLFPEYWADEPTCSEQCTQWSLGQYIAVDMCINFIMEGHFDENPGDPGGTPCHEAASDACMDPPAELPDGSLEVCEAVDELCEGEGGGMAPSTDYCAWATLGILAALPDYFGEDFEAALECVLGLEECPQEGEWLSCFIEIWEPGMDACQEILPCFDEIDPPGGEPFTLDECSMFMTSMHANNPQTADALVDCIDTAANCNGIFACLPEDGE